MRRLLASFAFAATCAALAGCAGSLVGDIVQNAGAPARAQSASHEAQQALAAITPGTSTKADVQRALGNAIVIRFDSGYEVWVYRWKGVTSTPRGETEFVVLFDASGVARKTRIRPGYA